MADVDYEDMSFQARKVLEEIYSVLGPGLRDTTYKRAFAQELTRRNIPFEQDKAIPITYKDATIDEYSLDFVLWDKLFVHVAAEGGHPGLLKTQVVSYLKGARLQRGLLVDMNVQSFKLHQIVNPAFVLGSGGGASAAEEEPAERLPRQKRKPKGSEAIDKLFGE